MADLSKNFVYEESDDAGDERIDTVLKGLREHARGYSIPAHVKEFFAIFAYEGDTVVGGLTAATCWSWLDIKLLWVAPSARNKGVGRSLIEQAIEKAKAADCVGAQVNTYSFQSKEFYEKLGFEVFGSLFNSPPGHTRYYLMQDFD